MKMLYKAVYAVIVCSCIWIAISSMAYRFNNPNKTETEVFLHIPYSFILIMDE